MPYLNQFFILSFIIVLLGSCKHKEQQEKNDIPEKTSPSHLQLDHFNIWVTDPALAKQKLIDIGLTAVPDSMSAIHHGQGTSGRYFNFLNGYLELIFVHDQKELEENNKVNPELDFTLRSKSYENGASPFSVALKMIAYDKDSIPFETIQYQQEWMESDDAIYSARNSKLNPQEPSIFVVFPGMQAITFDSTEELLAVPGDDNSWKALFQHDNGAEKITQMIIHSKDLNPNTKSIKALNQVDGIIVKKGNEHLMELYLDDGAKGKKYDLRPELPLIIYH